MTTMRQLESLLRSSFPEVTIEYNPPLLSPGRHYLHMRTTPFITVLWLPESGFYIADPADEGALDAGRFFEHETVADTFEHVQQLLGVRQATASAR